MALLPFQFSFNGLTFGAGTGFGVTKFDWSMPPVSKNNLPRTRLDGSYVGLDLAQPRPISFDFDIANQADGLYFTNREAWATAFVLAPTTSLPLSWLITGWANPRRIYGRPEKRSMPEDNVSAVALSQWAVVLDCEDPIIYGDNQLSFGPASSINITNIGDYSAGAGPTAGIVVLTVSSACTVSGPSGGSLTFTGTGPWTVDLGTHQITGGNGYSDLTQPATWFTIPSGGGTVSVSAGTVSAVSRDAWM
jgi:hypothetical protein